MKVQVIEEAGGCHHFHCLASPAVDCMFVAELINFTKSSAFCIYCCNGLYTLHVMQS